MFDKRLLLLVPGITPLIAGSVYDKLVELGPLYIEQGSTAEAVQTSVEGAQRWKSTLEGVQLNSINVMDLVAFGGAAAGVVAAVLQLALGRIDVASAFLVAVVGESGSGKSTLAGILPGHKTSYVGELTAGGVDVRDATLESLVRAVTLVPTGRASRDAAGSISSYVLDGLRGLSKKIQLPGAPGALRGLPRAPTPWALPTAPCMCVPPRWRAWRTRWCQWRALW